MGMNFALLNFILSSTNFYEEKSIGKKILEIGKLKNSLTKREILYISKAYNIPEEILKSQPKVIYEYLGFEVVYSLDNSEFEGANLVKNLNTSPTENDEEKSGYFDLVIDGGTSEHIYSPITALANYFNYLKIGGSLFQILPSNNYIDHGLYQFSPTFFWSIRDQGIKLTKLHFAERSEKNEFYWDGLSINFKKHMNNSFDGSGFANLLRYRTKNIVALAQWQKISSIDFKSLIQNSYQEVYLNKWENKNSDTKSNSNSLFEKFVIYTYSSRLFILRYVVANLLLKFELQKHKVHRRSF
jgi:hypothetical protein